MRATVRFEPIGPEQDVMNVAAVHTWALSRVRPCLFSTLVLLEGDNSPKKVQ